MMHVFDWPLMASLANSGRPCDGATARRFPPDAITARRTALPSRMVFSVGELGLPLSHAAVVTKDTFRMEVARWASHLFAAPLARMRDKVASARIRRADLRRHATRERTEPLVSLSGTVGGFSTGLTFANGQFAPSRPQVTGARTEPLLGPSILRRVLVMALFAVAALGSVFHALIITHEERYCEIAVKRLQQEVLPLELEPQLEQADLFVPAGADRD
jgi:hypothetical protein